ncbi:MAG: diaminopimelate epimerase [Leptospiraceae bacterium]|nr:diaminopimelate epimerase [Leptospiraceae bacterium]
MEGIGNDYVYVDATKEDIRLTPEQIQKISHRNFGVGSDGVIFIRPSKVADFQMDMYNSDGSSSEMCGNGIRCVGKYIFDYGLTSSKTPKIETGKGILELDMETDSTGKVHLVTVDMGEPILVPSKVPVKWNSEDTIINQSLTIKDHTLQFTAVSMGNPHAVIYVDDSNKFPVREIGPLVENHELFPRRINAEFVSIIGKDHLFQRTWERGAGETLACGTGACAVAVSSYLNGKTGRKVQIDLLGGTLYIDWTEKGNVIMKGPATTVFEGEITI